MLFCTRIPSSRESNRSADILVILLVKGVASEVSTGECSDKDNLKVSLRFAASAARLGSSRRGNSSEEVTADCRRAGGECWRRRSWWMRFGATINAAVRQRLSESQCPRVSSHGKDRYPDCVPGVQTTQRVGRGGCPGTGSHPESAAATEKLAAAIAPLALPSVG
jgi:hypothetical protein